MKTIRIVAGLFLLLCLPAYLWSQRGPGGGGHAGGFHGPVGGGSHPSFHGSPSMSGVRPAQAMHRPSGGSLVPNNRPAGDLGQRPGGNLNRPGGFEQRPGGGGIANRPGAGGSGTQWRPGNGGIANRPGAGGGGTQWRPGNGIANRPGAGGGGTQWRPGEGNQPGWANRPGAGGGTQWGPGNGNRPGWANRPGAGGGGTQWGPGNGNRPWGPGDRPAIVNRPTNNIFNQNNTNIFNQNNITNNRFTNINQNNFASVNRPWGYNNYHANWSDWHSGYWNNWHSCPAAWFGAGAAAGAVGNWMFSPGPSYSYSNPFYVQPASYVEASAPDYSQPIAVPTPVVNYTDNSSYMQNYVAPDESAETAQAPQPQAAEQSGADRAAAANASQAPPEVAYDFDKARAEFKGGDYATSLQTTDQAIKGLPGDATLHEFRALVLFAQKKYKDAAAGTYAVLSVGPGMNWATMSGLYSNVDTYRNQLRDLEAYVREHREASDGRFLLAYHYLALGHTEQAVKQLDYFAQLVPSDKLASELIKAFTQEPDTGKPKAQAG